jgi:hypothetical protein
MHRSADPTIEEAARSEAPIWKLRAETNDATGISTVRDRGANSAICHSNHQCRSLDRLPMTKITMLLLVRAQSCLALAALSEK